VAPHHALLAASGVLLVALVAVFATGDRAQRLSDATHAAIGSQFATVGFKLRAVKVQGASPEATSDILKAARVYKDQPLLGMNLEDLRQRILAVGWVKDVRVVRMLPDTLVLKVVERRQLAVWQHAGRSRVIDEHGQVIPEADPARFPTLPLIVGDGASEHAAEILAAVARRPMLQERLEAVVRVDGRRWDLRLKDGGLIQLPSSGEEAALMQLEQIDRKSGVLTVGFDRIDMRDPNVVAVRPRGAQPAPGQLVADGV